MSSQADSWPVRLDFFRAIPRDMEANPPLASSLQNLEASLLLIGLSRYPQALVACTSAVEGAFKARFKLPDDGSGKLGALLLRAQKEFKAIGKFDQVALVRFREARNRLVHYGFSPRDDEESALLLLEVGYPFLALCYQEMFGFHLDWKTLKSDANSILELDPNDRDRAGFLPNVAFQWRVANTTFQRARHAGITKSRYCYAALGHFMALCVKDGMQSAADAQVIEHAESWGGRYEQQARRKNSAEREFQCSWEMDCPVCGGVGTVVVELDSKHLDQGEVVPSRLLCAECDFVVASGMPFLAEELMAEQVTAAREQILREFGVS